MDGPTSGSRDGGFVARSAKNSSGTPTTVTVGGSFLSNSRSTSRIANLWLIPSRSASSVLSSLISVRE